MRNLIFDKILNAGKNPAEFLKIIMISEGGILCYHI